MSPTLWFRTALILACFSCLGAAAQLVGDPAGPRTGVVYELRLSPPNADTLGALNSLGFNIGHVTSDYAEIFATPGEYDYLVANGYAVSIVGQQPAPPAFSTTTSRALGVYHSYASLTSELQAYASAYPSLTRLKSIGLSVQGKTIWAMHISDFPAVNEDEPEFKYVSTMHGDEPVGTEMCLYLIDYLLTNYGSDSRVTDLVNDTSIWIVPLMNPDGLDAGTRNNANGFDLNRSFPNYPEDYSSTVANGAPILAGLEPEVVALMNWSYGRRFVLSANFHTGAVVVSYPFDGAPGIISGQPALTPDHDLFVDLSTTYASNNPPMFANNSFPFENGIVNGNEWYVVTGGMQDWMYRFMGDAEVTIELAVPKKPAQAQLTNYWNDNRESMLSYLEWVYRGVRGVVTDANTTDPLSATVRVLGNPQLVFTDSEIGDYYRLLTPGTYSLAFNAIGYESVIVPNVVVTSGAATQVDVALAPLVGLRGSGSISLFLLCAVFVISGAWRIRVASTARSRRRADGR